MEIQNKIKVANQLIYKNTLDLGQFNLLHPELSPWLSLIKIENQKSHKTVQQILELIICIPEIRIIRNLILPNWVICSVRDIDFGLYGLLSNELIWGLSGGIKYKWIDARGITVYHQKVRAKLLDILVMLCPRCEYIIYQPHSIIPITEFWGWLTSCSSLTDTNRAQIIFMKPSESKTYRTSAAGVIPLEIARIQNEFYKSNPDAILGSPGLINNIINTKPNNNNKEDTDNLKSLGTKYNIVNPGSSENSILLIQEIDKLRLEILAYNLSSPDELEIETGAILEKIKEIREHLGIGNRE